MEGRETARLRLELVDQSHVPQLFALMSDPALYELYDNDPWPEDRIVQQLQRWEQRISPAGKVWEVFAISLCNTRTVVGFFQISTESSESVSELGYMVGRKFWNRGYASEVMVSMADAVAARPRIVAMTAHIASTNVPSQRVASRGGLRPTALYRQSDGDELWHRPTLPVT